MNWSWRIARLAGIDVYMHWTFLLLLGWIGASYLAQGSGVAEALMGILFVLTIFGCVVLHELGHALTARRFGIQTRDITLLPIGGVARLERMPREPMQELWVALAGPAVNVVIAALLMVYLWVVAGLPEEAPKSLVESSFAVSLLAVNVLLVLFNLLPAFPMDGGRVLRALLATRMEYSQATEAAANVGQLMAILFGVAGLYYSQWMLLFIALFVYLGAQAEARMVQIQSILAGVPVRDAMITRFQSLAPGDTLRHAADELLAGDQRDFPVVQAGELLGMLRRQRLVNALAEAGDQATVDQFMEREVCTVDERDMLEQLSTSLQSGGGSTAAVLRDGVVVGLVSTENIGELMMIRSARRRERERTAV